jgi:lysophospholipase L1-like esterase
MEAVMRAVTRAEDYTRESSLATVSRGNLFQRRAVRRLVALALVLALLALPLQGEAASSLVGPKAYYLALGDSLAYGYQPNFDFSHGYADQWYSYLSTRGARSYVNYGCNGETSSSFINGGCPYGGLKRTRYSGTQLSAAVSFIKGHPGKVSPVSLDIGANDMLDDIDLTTCTVSGSWGADLADLDQNLTGTILPQLVGALTSKTGARTGDLVMMNYYNPYQNECPDAMNYILELNQHLAAAAAQFNVPIADVFAAFGGETTPNPNICTYTWMCRNSPDIHPSGGRFGEPGNGYGAITGAFKKITGY